MYCSSNKKDLKYPKISNFFCGNLSRRTIGRMRVVLSGEKGRPVVIAGSSWPFCAFVTVPLILVPAAIVSALVIVPMAPTWLICVYYPWLALVLISLFFVSCRDPGLVLHTPKPASIEDGVDRSGWVYNSTVKSYRPRGAFYCHDNDVVVEKYDHFCPWTGTSIGGRNMTAFKLFVFSSNVLCYGTILIVVLVCVL